MLSVPCVLFIVFITNKTLSYQSVRQPHAPTTTHSLTSSETHTDSLRALDAANQTCKQKERHGEKVHNEKASKPPGLACCRTGSRARSCGGQAVVSLASQREPLPTGSGHGAHLHLPKTPPPVREGEDIC
jgi:hypothetical protein